MQKDWKLEEIKRLEKERDRNLAIHCNYVASKHQRLIAGMITDRFKFLMLTFIVFKF